jgi:DNA-binding NtrC family response regulator
VAVDSVNGSAVSGLRLIANLHQSHPMLPVIAIGEFDALSFMGAIKAGAKTCIDKQNKDTDYWLNEFRNAEIKSFSFETSDNAKDKYSLLVVDDDQRLHTDFRFIFKRNYEFESAMSAVEMWDKLSALKGKTDLIVLDMKLDGHSIESGLQLIQPLKTKYPHVPIIAVTADDKISTAVKAIKLGANGFIPKSDVDFDYWNRQIIEVIESSKNKGEVRQLKQQVSALKQGAVKDTYPFIGESERAQETKKMLQSLAQRPNMTVLLIGETGVGKEVAARYFHSCSARSRKPFVSVNLSAIPKSLLESALFGSVKGAFTDAKTDVTGYFSQADGGILMLDEIGEIDHDIQVKLLRFLEQRTIRPVGASKDIELDVQIIAATNKDLNELVMQNKFRDDLRYRITFSLEIPTLRVRRDDIPLILEHYTLEKFGLLSTQIYEDKVVEKIKSFDWPGNVRQLTNVIEGMMIWMDLYGLKKVNLRCFEEALKSTLGALSSSKPNNSGYMPQVIMQQPTADYHPVRAVSRKKTKAIEDMSKIEVLLKNGNAKKADLVAELGYKGTDHLRARIRTCYDNYPEIFDQFPSIRSHYAL